MKPAAWALAAAALLASCSATGPKSGSVEAGAPDRERTALEALALDLLEADRAFAARAVEAGAPQAFAEYFDEMGLQVGPTGAPSVGPLQVQARMAQSTPGVLSWEPRFAEVFAPGDSGWTWGEWQMHERGAGGRRLSQGRYVNVWARQSDGKWKVRLDFGSVEPER